MNLRADNPQSKITLRIGLSDLLTLSLSGWLVFSLSGLAEHSFIVFYSQDNYFEVSYQVFTIFLSLGWFFLVSFNGSRRLENLGYGSYEFFLLSKASVYLALALGVGAFIFNASISRLFVFFFFVAGLIFLFTSRLLQRKIFIVERVRGEFMSPVLLVGQPDSVEVVLAELLRYPAGGYLPAGVCTNSLNPGHKLHSVEVLGAISDIETIFDERFDAIIFCDSEDIGHERLKEIGWFLEPLEKKMIIVPQLLDVAGPRIHNRPLAGLSLIEISVPNSSSFQQWAKRFFDFVLSLMLTMLLIPLGLVIAALIRLEDNGPVFFVQRRVGIYGKEFSMYKFRSMRIDAEEIKNQLISDDENSVLFKMKEDPRITRIGKFLRKFSIDELPQLINVILGDMSIVGPRPPLLSEVQQYDDKVHRKFLVRPGITGLWQVSGRSNLSWDESVRLDLYYVENWSLVTDFFILLKTFKAVFSRNGAY